LAVLDDCTDHVWSFFIKKKNYTVDKVLILINHLKANHDLTVKYVSCDNAGENIKLEEACKKAGLGIQFEYTSPGTPQRNARVKQKFAALYGRVRAMMNHAALPHKMRKGLWAKCARTATPTKNIIVTPTKPVSSFSQFYEKEAPYPRSLRNFGEIGVMANHADKTIRAKLADQGKVAMLLGYPDSHANDNYRMWNLKTERMILSRDVLWLNKSSKTYIREATGDDILDDTDALKHQT
jgi:hypothetical protein